MFTKTLGAVPLMQDFNSIQNPLDHLHHSQPTRIRVAHHRFCPSDAGASRLLSLYGHRSGTPRLDSGVLRNRPRVSQPMTQVDRGLPSICKLVNARTI
jgi:hypothetical protein